MSDIFSVNLEIKETKKGKGIYSKVFLPADHVILEFKGDIISKDQIKNYMDALQITEKTYLGLSGDVDDYVHHSCNPNCGLHIVGNRALLVALWDVKAGDEVTFDYSTSSNDTKDEWELACVCGTSKCRKKISGYQYLDDATKNYYESRGVVPSYLIRK